MVSILTKITYSNKFRLANLMSFIENSKNKKGLEPLNKGFKPYVKIV